MAAPRDTLRLVILSDTHGLHDRLTVPEGDVLLHAGDLTPRGRVEEVAAVGNFLAQLPHREKVVIAGNHDFLFEREPERARELLGGLTYLQDSGAEVAGLQVWGSPWQPWFHDWAFHVRRVVELGAIWSLVPAGVDVLLTHGPPHGILDRTHTGEPVGCEELTRALDRIRPRLHAFGHIHEAYGTERRGETLYVNACNCNLEYDPIQEPIVVDWDGAEMRIVEA